MNTKTMKLHPGTTISEAVVQMVELAKQENVEVHADFNDIHLFAVPTTVAADLEAHFWTMVEEQRRAYEASPEGQAAKARQEAFEEKAAAAKAEGVLPFKIKEGAQELWEEHKRIDSQDPYSACTLRYTARWANLMEQKMQQGLALKDIADQASHEADVEGITGFMYGCAVACLAGVWEHGEELRRWHNITTQIRDEGERANETGGVLNPACLTIG